MQPFEWSKIIDALGDAVIAADRDGSIVYANPAVDRLLGWAPGDLVGQPLIVIMPERMRPAHEEGFRRYLSTGVARLIGRSVRVPALRKDGAELDIELTLTAQRVEQGQVFVAMLRDLRERVELERQLGVTKYVAAATRAAARLAERLELQHVVSVAVTTLAQDLDAALARLWLRDPASGSLELSASAGLSDQVEGSARRRIDPATYPYKVGAVARTLRPFLSNELVGDDEFEQEWIRREGLKAVAVLPLLCGGELRGVLAAFFRRRLADELFELLGTFGALVASALENTRLYTQAQEAIKERDEFLSMASHELRTPLTPLVLSLESLRRVVGRGDGVASETVQPKLTAAVRATSHIESLVSRMLDVARVHEGRYELRLETFNLVGLLGEVVDRHRAQVESLGCTLLVHTPEAVVGTWDRLRLDQVIANLLSNALKYGRARPIDVRLAASDDQVTLTVTDRGIGIAAGDQERVFDRFERAVSGDKYGGLGLGLWITRKFVEAMGGAVSVASTPGEGSAFTVVLPRHGPRPVAPDGAERGVA